MSKPTQEDCVNCGACCWLPNNNAGHHKLNARDIERLKPLGLVVKHRTFKLPVLRNKSYDHGDGIVCSALQGEVGVEVSCGIYSIRPAFCRRYAPGSQACLDARKQLSIE